MMVLMGLGRKNEREERGLGGGGVLAWEGGQRGSAVAGLGA